MVFRSIYTIFAPKISNYMDIKELYKLYQQHPCITTDSRDCPKGSIFLALKGESFDGNKFAIQALEKGCAYAIIDEPEIMESGKLTMDSYDYPKRDDDDIKRKNIDSNSNHNYPLSTLNSSSSTTAFRPSRTWPASIVANSTSP